MESVCGPRAYLIHYTMLNQAAALWRTWFLFFISFLFLCDVCICMSMYGICICAHVCGCTCLWVHRGHKRMPGVLLYCFPSYSHETWLLTEFRAHHFYEADWPVSELPGSSCLCLSLQSYRDMRLHSAFVWMMEIQTQVPMLVQQALLTTKPSPSLRTWVITVIAVQEITRLGTDEDRNLSQCTIYI